MNNFDNIFIDDNSLKTVMIIDGHNIAYRCLYSTMYNNPEDNDFYLWRHNFLNNIFSVVTKFSPNILIIAFDEKGSWRYDVYSKYKAHRKESRENNKIKINWELFFSVFDEFISDIKNTFTNIYIMKLPKCEGDDIIGVLSTEVFKTENVIVVSNDSDMHQLLVYPNISQYDPKTLSLVECLNPQTELEIKILQGDTSDNITGVRRGVGPITAEKIFELGIDEYINTLKIKVNRKMKISEWMTPDDILQYCEEIDETGRIIENIRPQLTDDEIQYFIQKEKQMIYDNYERNKILINLKYIPDNIKTSIINMYNSYNIQNINSKKIIDFFKRNKMIKHLCDWNNVSEYFKNLNS